MNNESALSPISDPDDWDVFVLRHEGHVLQTAAWGELKNRYGWRAERWARVERGEVCAGAQVLFRRLLPGLEVAYVPRGPVLADVAFFDALKRAVSRPGVFLFKLEPDWLEGDTRVASLTAAGWSHSAETIQPHATIRIDLTRSLDDILAGMKPKWRYNIRLAEKKGVTVRQGSEADLAGWYGLTRLTSERDHFSIHSERYYRDAYRLLVERDMARLLVAEYGGRSLAMIFVTLVGREAIYLYGASGNESRNVMPNHALHWDAIKLAKERGCTHYDLWGVPDDLTEGSERLPGSLYQFKRGFGGEIIRYVGAFDRVTGRMRYRLYLAARKAKSSGLG